jgi:hypothetical protein
VLAHLVWVLLVLVSTGAYADAQRITAYDYDDAGNIIGIRTVQNTGPPDVISLQPAFININNSRIITATGFNLNQATVSTAAPGLTITNVTASANQITFTLRADELAFVGPATLNFTTRLGTDQELFIIAEKTPVISTDPNPIVLAPDNQAVEVSLIFDKPFEVDQVYDLAITATSVASVLEQTVTLLAGEREVSVQITGHAPGSTTLAINQLSNYLALGIPVIVTDLQLPAGNYTFNAKPVGVAAFVAQDISSDSLFITRSVGVVSFIDQAINSNSTFLTPSIGVVTFIAPDAAIDGIFVNQPAGVLLGIVADQISPSSVSPGTSLTLTLSGFELDAVAAASFIPAEGITITGGLSVAPDGRQLAIPISIDLTAPLGARVISLTTSQGEVLVSQPLLIE